MTDKLLKIQEYLSDLEDKLCEIAEEVAEIADKKKKDKDGGKGEDGGIIEPAETGEGAPPRVTIEGTCDGNVTLISQTNGKDDTLMYPKNAGTCGNLTIFCRDSLDRKNETSVVTLKPGKSLRRYDTGRNTHSMVFSCDGNTKDGKCILEFDR